MGLQRQKWPQYTFIYDTSGPSQYLGAYPVLKRYPGTKPGYIVHTRVCTRVPNLAILVILGYVPRYQPWLLLLIFRYVLGYQTWLYWSYPGMYPGAKPGCIGHTRCTRVPVILVILGYVAGYKTWLYWSYPGMYPARYPTERTLQRLNPSETARQKRPHYATNPNLYPNPITNVYAGLHSPGIDTFRLCFQKCGS